MTPPIFQKSGRVLVARISAALTDADHEAVASALEAAIAMETRIRLILAISPYPSFNSAEDLYDDLRFVYRFADHIERVAIISDAAWKQTFIGLFSLFSGVPFAFFTPDEKDTATKWIQAP